MVPCTFNYAQQRNYVGWLQDRLKSERGLLTLNPMHSNELLIIFILIYTSVQHFLRDADRLRLFFWQGLRPLEPFQ